MKVAFVILNYNTKPESIDCIESIIGLWGEKQIVLVDNCSKESVGEISIKYPEVKIICSEYNVGFARGNNIGYQYAKHVIQPDYIVILNSDVVINQRDFINQIDRIYEETHYDILGPDIVTLTMQHQNPVHLVLRSYSEVKKAIWINRLRYLKTYFPCHRRVNSRVLKEEYKKERSFSCALHGSCLVFSRSFINNHEHAFYPDTFLYGEEEFLYFNAIQKNEVLLYSPEVGVVHKEDASTNKMPGTGAKKKRFILSNSIQSLKKLKVYMKNNGYNV